MVRPLRYAVTYSDDVMLYDRLIYINPFKLCVCDRNISDVLLIGILITVFHLFLFCSFEHLFCVR